MMQTKRADGTVPVRSIIMVMLSDDGRTMLNLESSSNAQQPAGQQFKVRRRSRTGTARIDTHLASFDSARQALGAPFRMPMPHRYCLVPFW
jgi:hypothetical protein